MSFDPKKFKNISLGDLRRHVAYHKNGNFDEYWGAKSELNRRADKNNFWYIKIPIWITLVLSVIFFVLN